MDSENPHVFLDSSSPEIVYTGACEVSTSNANDTWGGSQHVCQPTSAVDIKFYGKGLEVFGELDTSLHLDSSMDDATYTRLPDEFEGIASGTKGVKLFDLGALSNPHTVHLEPTSGRLIVDYVIYTPVGKTKLDGKQLIYDDTNPSFTFSGDWTHHSAFEAQGLGALPFNDTLAGTTQNGSSFSIEFVGSTVAVYGAFNSSAGSLSATFSVDGSAPSPLQLLNQSAGTTEADWSLHQALFQYTFSEANTEAPHVLNVTVVEASESQAPVTDTFAFSVLSAVPPRLHPYHSNSHTALKERQFKKTGSEAKKTGMRIGLIILGIVVLLYAWYVWRKWRERRKKAKEGQPFWEVLPGNGTPRRGWGPLWEGEGPAEGASAHGTVTVTGLCKGALTLEQEQGSPAIRAYTFGFSDNDGMLVGKQGFRSTVCLVGGMPVSREYHLRLGFDRSSKHCRNPGHAHCFWHSQYPTIFEFVRDTDGNTYDVYADYNRNRDSLFASHPLSTHDLPFGTMLCQYYASWHAMPGILHLRSQPVPRPDCNPR
ncbi:hypothetical protein NMY22_g5272 [Coprinellus aureogranulatus]|nr:hypothetical protein NMY22_g5272 [Coprinellus aureogranulatus]